MRDNHFTIGPRWEEQDSNLRRQSRLIYSQIPLATRKSSQDGRECLPTIIYDATEGTLHLIQRSLLYPMGHLGFEPRTNRLKAEYSTAELMSHIMW